MCVRSYLPATSLKIRALLIPRPSPSRKKEERVRDLLPMFREFFLPHSCHKFIVPWVGLACVVCHSLFGAWLKYRLNNWYSEFYDSIQEGTSLLSNSTVSTPAFLAEERGKVADLLWSFVFIVSPAVVVHPVFRWVRSAWSFKWRMSLVVAYTRHWDANSDPIEGASQRLHEDTQRFARGLEVCLSVVLDSVCTLAVFTPILVQLGSHVLCPSSEMARLVGEWWLFASASSPPSSASEWRWWPDPTLVQLEVNNQKVEASFRKDLVLLETNPSILCGVTTLEEDGSAFVLSPVPVFKEAWSSLRRNYFSLFRNFSCT